MNREISEDELERMTAQMRVADKGVDNGAFESTSHAEAAIWLKLIVGDAFRGPTQKVDEAQAKKRLRHALWDAQRIDMLFHGKTFSTSAGKLKIDSLPSWPNWEKPNRQIWRENEQVQLDANRDAKKLNALLWRHFQMSAFTQMENMTGSFMNRPDDITGAWTSVKLFMAQVAKDITQEGKQEAPFIVFTSDDCMLVVEVLTVKQCRWPEPTKREMSVLKEVNSMKFGCSPGEPLVPMLETPVFPLIAVRYAYFEGRPEGGSKYVQRLMQNTSPGLTSAQARGKLQDCLAKTYGFPLTHLRMCARTLSANADLVDADYVREQQSHWNSISQDVARETRISFIAPCMRLRWRALEEIDTGVSLTQIKACHGCGKSTDKLVCGSCKSVYYCGAACNKSDWHSHKATCKFSNQLNTSPSALPSSKYYVPLRCLGGITSPSVGFTLETEELLQSGACAPGEIAVNEYGDARFLVSVMTPPAYDCGGVRGRSAFVWDRRRSILARSGPGEVKVIQERLGVAAPFHKSGHEALEKIMKRRGYQGQQMFMWAKRMGDCVELDLEDLPDQGAFHWN